MTDWNAYSLAELRDHTTERYRTAHGSRPDVLLIEIDGQQAVLKDFSHSDRLFSRIIGPLLVYREVRSLVRLEGLPGIPRLIRHINRYAFLIEAIEATPASKLRNCGYPPSFYETMHHLLDDMHGRGVVHCDLRSAGNTLIDRELRPWLVDFVASIHQGSRWNLPARWIFRQFTRVDHNAVLKLKKRLSPELLTAEELEAMSVRGNPLERLARQTGIGIRKLTRKLFTNKPRMHE